MSFLTALTMTWAIVAAPTHAPTPAPTQCTNALVRTLVGAGFTGPQLRTAWAIVMRESGGNPTSISRTHDYGLFQFNRATWKTQAWWNPKKLLTATYNARIAYTLTDGGRTFYPWDVNGQGKYLARYSTPYDFQKFSNFQKAYPC